MNAKIEVEGRQSSDLTSSDRIKLAQYEDLIKKLFYACEKCEGPLVQLATCLDCKKTAMRICTGCNTVVIIPHASCTAGSTRGSTKLFLGVKN